MFETTARLRVRDGQVEGFKQQVADIVRQTREKEDKPLRYDWFLSEDGTECEVHEAFVDGDALLEHQRSIGEAKMRLFRDSVDGHTMTLHGEPSPALLEALEAMGTEFTRFSLLEGLDADVGVSHAVPAQGRR